MAGSLKDCRFRPRMLGKKKSVSRHPPRNSDSRSFWFLRTWPAVLSSEVPPEFRIEHADKPLGPAVPIPV